MSATFRVGRKVGRTIYVATAGSSDHDDDDKLIGMMDSRALAAMFVEVMNVHGALCELEREARREHTIERDGRRAYRHEKPITVGALVGVDMRVLPGPDDCRTCMLLRVLDALRAET